MSVTINHKLDLITEECCVCNVVFAVPANFQNRKMQTGESFYCPNGHGQSYSKPENAKLKEDIQRLQQRLSAAEEAARLVRESAQKTELKLKRLEKRTANGVCPCCERSFQNLQRHMNTKHPEYAK